MTWDYITGFFDADGSVTAVLVGNKEKNKTLQVSFHNNEINILKEIQSFIFQELGFKGSISLKPAKKETHNDAYELKFVYRQALEVANKMTSIHPKKKHRIEIYNLIQQLTKRNGKYTEQEINDRNALIEEFFRVK